MDIQQLTHKNQEFINIATHQLIRDGKTDTEIKSILEAVLPEILENQKKGIPARNFLGAPTVWAASFSQKVSEAASQKPEKNTNPWLMWLDSSILILAVVTLINALMTFFGSQGQISGITAIILLSLTGGAAMYATYHFVYRHQLANPGQRPNILKNMGILLVIVLVWVTVFTATSLLATSLNPVLPAWTLLIIAVLAFAGRYWLQKKYNILNAMAPQRP